MTSLMNLEEVFHSLNLRLRSAKRSGSSSILKKSTKAVLHFILAGIVSVISYIGFKKGVESVNDKIDEEE